jgi:hypothetical protein
VTTTPANQTTMRRSLTTREVPSTSTKYDCHLAVLRLGGGSVTFTHNGLTRSYGRGAELTD